MAKLLHAAIRTRLNLPDGKLGAITAVQTLGDYLIFHPHLHVLVANGLFPPAPAKQSARDMRPLWRDLILQTWGSDPRECPCCKGTMKPVRKVIRREEIQFFLRLHGLWEGIIELPRPPPPPFDIKNMEPIEPPWQAIQEWIPDEEPDLDGFNRPQESERA
jgi:hypothetical protein